MDQPELMAYVQLRVQCLNAETAKGHLQQEGIRVHQIPARYVYRIQLKLIRKHIYSRHKITTYSYCYLFIQCTDTSCSTKNAIGLNEKKPFCGNTKSAAADNKNNVVDIGVCGKCQVKSGGGGGASMCTKTSNAKKTCPDTTSCGSSKVCCSTGECAKDQSECSA